MNLCNIIIKIDDFFRSKVYPLILISTINKFMKFHPYIVLAEDNLSFFFMFNCNPGYITLFFTQNWSKIFRFTLVLV